MEHILATKLYFPTPRPNRVSRPHLVERLNAGLHRKLTLVSAPAGFGKTSLVGEWVAGCGRAAAWLSLDEEDGDLNRFLVYFVAALQILAKKADAGIPENIGEGVLGVLRVSQIPPGDSILRGLVNEIAALKQPIVFILDDYHAVDSKLVDEALGYLLKHLPPQMHLVITTREDPAFPLAQLRARDQLTELRVADLRFSADEAAAFLNEAMRLNLSKKDISILGSRTEGWIAGLQLAAVALAGNKDVEGFIKSFSGSHRYILDYLVEEVLEQQPEGIQTFMLQTAILERLSAPLCNAVTGREDGQVTLEYLENANLFIVPLDQERKWYRYHHLFADLLRKQLFQRMGVQIDKLRVRASEWFEANGMEIEAFHHAAAANDFERAERLMEGDGMPLQFRGAMAPVMDWLASLPKAVFDTRPALWISYALTLTMMGKPVTNIEEKLQAAETLLTNTEPEDNTQDLFGQIAAIRAMLAIPQNQIGILIDQAHRALELLHPANLPVRTTLIWTLGYAYQRQGDRAAASQAFAEAIPISQASGNLMITIAALTSLGQVQESENKLFQASENYQRVLQLVGDPPLPVACEAHLGLARISYQWNDLDAALNHGQQSISLAQPMPNVDTPVSCGVFLSRLKLAQGDTAGAAAGLAETQQFAQQNHFTHRIADVAAEQVPVFIQQGNLAAAVQLVETHDLPMSRARVLLAQGDAAAASTVLEPFYQQMKKKGWVDDQLKAAVLLAGVFYEMGDKDRAHFYLSEALTLAQPAGIIRAFVDEGSLMAAPLREAARKGSYAQYIAQLLAAFDDLETSNLSPQPLIEPLSERELEVLRLLRSELNGPEIARELMVSLNTMRTHTKNIYNKLGVNNRRAAVRQAEELNLL